MTVPANTFETYDAIGNREDLADAIFDISPTETPFMSSIGRNQATATNHEWQKDSLTAASASNAQIEGDDATTDAAVPTVRNGNYTQISTKVPRVTGTQRNVDSAGRGDEFDYQILKAGKELKRDMESALLASNAKVAGSSGTARELGGIESWIATNRTTGAGGSDPTGDGTDVGTIGTPAAFTEAQLKTSLASIWDEGGDPDLILAGSFNRQAMSAFTGNASREISANEQKLNASIKIYVSDFGELQVMPSRFQVQGSVLILDTDMWKLSTLRSFEETPLAKTGDSDRVMLLSEYTLESSNEAASGIIAGRTTS